MTPRVKESRPSSILLTLLPRLKRSEGWRSYLYVDTTSNLTIAYGMNLAHVAIVPSGAHVVLAKNQKLYQVEGGHLLLTTVSEIPENIGDLLLVQKVLSIIEVIDEKRPWIKKLDDVRREVIIELCFNIGLAVLDYGTFMSQLERGLFKEAADNMRSWKWYDQVHATRAEPLCVMMETGNREE